MADTPITPDQEDIDAVERRLGSLPINTTEAQRAERYRVWQAQKLIRLMPPALEMNETE